MSREGDSNPMPGRPFSDEEAAQRAIDWAVEAGVASRIGLEAAARARRRRGWRVGAGLGAATALAVALGLHGRFSRTQGTTAVAEAQPLKAVVPSFVSFPGREVLPDGSVVELREGARISVDFTPGLRRVALLSGEAHFKVAKNPRRPFVVSAAGIETRAVGTAFCVHLAASTVEVLVTEGRVSVGHAARPEAGGGPRSQVFVSAGSRAIVTLASPGSAAVEPVSPRQMGESLSWRVPLLRLAGTPVSEVIPLMNEYGGSRIVLGDSTLSTLRLSGSLRADNTSSFLGILKLQFGVRAEDRGGVVMLYRR